MTAMFPDRGVEAIDAKNTILYPATVNCVPLWYSTYKCVSRFDPAAANAMLSEQINLINKAELYYDCNHLDDVQLAVRRLIQRGIPRYAYLGGGPSAYTAALDPYLTRYNAGLTLTVGLSTTNNGPTTINIDGLGPRWILQSHKGGHLAAGDMVEGKLYEIAYHEGVGVFFLLGIAWSEMMYEIGFAIDNLQDELMPIIDGKVNRIGDTMTGLLVLAQHPVNVMDAATKWYVDSSIAAIPPPPDISGKVNRVGDTMTGLLVLAQHPVNTMDAATKWYVDSLVVKLPKIMTADVDFWVSWDGGNDSTGDGTYDNPFQTINGCWQKVGILYLPSAFFAVNIRLKNPGDYAGPYLANYGGLVRIIGDENNPSVYRIISMSSGVPISTQCIWFAAISGECYGVNICNTGLAPVGNNGLIVERAASVMLRNCVLSNAAANNGGINVWVRSAGQLFFDHHNSFVGDNTTSYGCMLITDAGVCSHTGGLVQHTVSFTNLTVGSLSFLCSQALGSISLASNMFSSSNCHGAQYNVSGNGVIRAFGNPMPGDQPGTTSTGGQFMA